MILLELEKEFYLSFMDEVTKGVVESVPLFPSGELPTEEKVALIKGLIPNNNIFVFSKLEFLPHFSLQVNHQSR